MPEPAPLHITTRSGKVRVDAVGGHGTVDRGRNAEPRDDGSIHIRRDPSAKTIVVQCAPGTDVTVGTDSGSIDLLGSLGAVRVATMSGRIRVEDVARDRRAHEVGQGRHRHLCGRLPHHDEELGGARRGAARSRDRRGCLRCCHAGKRSWRQGEDCQRQGPDRSRGRRSHRGANGVGQVDDPSAGRDEAVDAAAFAERAHPIPNSRPATTSRSRSRASAARSRCSSG